MSQTPLLRQAPGKLQGVVVRKTRPPQSWFETKSFPALPNHFAAQSQYANSPYGFRSQYLLTILCYATLPKELNGESMTIDTFTACYLDCTVRKLRFLHDVSRDYLNSPHAKRPQRNLVAMAASKPPPLALLHYTKPPNQQPSQNKARKCWREKWDGTHFARLIARFYE